MNIDRRNAGGWVAVILAVAVGLALNLVTVAILYAAYVRVGADPNAGISDNGTLLLTGAFGSILGALSGYLGHVVGTKKDEPPAPLNLSPVLSSRRKSRLKLVAEPAPGTAPCSDVCSTA